MFEHAAPKFSPEEAAALALAHWGLAVSARPVDSYLDQNFRLDSDQGRFVLKIANAAAEDEYVTFQQDALCFLEEQGFAGVPSLVLNRDGKRSVCVNGHRVWMVRWLHGRVLADVNPVTGSLLEEIGHFLGRLDITLAGFDHAQAHRDFVWDLKKAPGLKAHLPLVDNLARRSMVQSILDDYEARVLPGLEALPHSIIHHDANDHNLLVGGKGYAASLSGLIDFGDALYSCTVAELAIAAAYAMFGRPDPVGAACDLVRGYHQTRPLQENELAVVFDLIRARLCVSVLLSARRASLEPDNEYHRISETGAWTLLEQLDAYPPRLAEYRWREACGLDICPPSLTVQAWLKARTAQFAPVMHPDVRAHRPKVLDLGITSSWTAPPGMRSDPKLATAAWFRRIARTGAKIGVGRYNEPRLVYTDTHYQSANNSYEETRTIHLGIDLFKEAGTHVYAPLDGEVYATHNSDDSQSFGGLIILKHQAGDVSFFTLYGHLSRDSASGCEVGQRVKAGQQIGTLGDPDENGGWIPHLHFQVIADELGLGIDLPGVAPASQRDVWLAICPDPNMILGIPDDCFPLPEPTAKEVLAQRHRHIAGNLSISYRNPLHIVRGYQQYLYDDTGRRYLDAVNNVPHVGHSHPDVVRAAKRQMPILNTNTRYLHRTLGEYAARLADTMPDPLQVCFFVNSGSEANDLALRLAYAYTRRRDIMVLEGAYHGHLSALIDISPYKFNGPGGEGAPDHVHVAAMPDTYRGLHRNSDAAEKYAAAIKHKLSEHPDQVAAFISESLLGCGGQVELPDGYLKAVYALVRESGGICIADEVQVGFGRIGTHFWGFETQDVVPDIVVLGKPMGNGHPLAGVVTTRAIAQAFDNGMEFFSTFGGNPVSTAVGMAVLDVIEEEGLQDNALQTGTWLLKALRELQDTFALIGDVRGRGLFVGIELVRDRETREPAAQEASYVANRLAELGVLISTDGADHNVLKIKPPLVFDTANAETLVTRLKRVLAEDFVQL